MVGYFQTCRRYPQDQEQPQDPQKQEQSQETPEQQQQSQYQNYQGTDILKNAIEKINKIKLATLNIANLLSKKKYKIKHLEALMRDEDIKVICLQETWLNDEILETETHI